MPFSPALRQVRPAAGAPCGRCALRQRISDAGRSSEGNSSYLKIFAAASLSWQSGLKTNSSSAACGFDLASVLAAL